MAYFNAFMCVFNLVLLICNIWQSICDRPARIIVSVEDTHGTDLTNMTGQTNDKLA